jgi:hypothetical protein
MSIDFKLQIISKHVTNVITGLLPGPPEINLSCFPGASTERSSASTEQN